jgi:hypothetical protein
VVELDPSSGSYRVGKEKSDLASTSELDEECVARLRVVHPPRQRQAVRVLNPFTEATRLTTDVANGVAGTGVRRDVMSYTQIAKQTEKRATLEGDRLRQRDHHVEVDFRQLPPAVPVPLLGFTLGAGLGPRIYPAGKTYRAIVLRLRATPPEDQAEPSDYDDTSKRFALELSVELERDNDPVPVLPPFQPPTYPVLAEGKVLSASGAETDRTWHALAGSEDSVMRYRVHVPLWNKTVVAPFLPSGESGHFFFPAYKNQRVLLAFEFDNAKVVSFLDWAGKLATETQGNQLIMGKRETSTTVMKHVYTDDSPVFTLARAQAGDLQTIELSEGRFFLEVKAEESQEQTAQTYDLTPQADVAKDAASSQARSSISNLTGSYQAAMSSTSAELNAASSELTQGVTDNANTLSAKTVEVEAQLSDSTAELEALADSLDEKVAAAKADLTAALEDD